MRPESKRVSLLSTVVRASGLNISNLTQYQTEYLEKIKSALDILQKEKAGDCQSSSPDFQATYYFYCSVFCYFTLVSHIYTHTHTYSLFKSSKIMGGYNSESPNSL